MKATIKQHNSNETFNLNGGFLANSEVPQMLAIREEECLQFEVASKHSPPESGGIR